MGSMAKTTVANATTAAPYSAKSVRYARLLCSRANKSIHFICSTL